MGARLRHACRRLGNRNGEYTVSSAARSASRCCARGHEARRERHRRSRCRRQRLPDIMALAGQRRMATARLAAAAAESHRRHHRARISGLSGFGPWPTVAQILQGVPPANNQPIVVDVLPGTQFRYSGGGTTIAQQAIADVTGRPFPQLMRELVLDPVGMTDSSFEQPPPPLSPTALPGAISGTAPRRPAAITSIPKWPPRALDHAQPILRCSGGSHAGTEWRSSKLGLTAETVSSMLRPQLPNQDIGQEFVGLGWFCSGEQGTFRFWHDGWNHGYVATMLMLPAIGKGVVVMVNSNSGLDAARRDRGCGRP